MFGKPAWKSRYVAIVFHSCVLRFLLQCLYADAALAVYDELCQLTLNPILQSLVFSAVPVS